MSDDGVLLGVVSSVDRRTGRPVVLILVDGTIDLAMPVRRAGEYAMAVEAAAGRAEYDAAVLRQIKELPVNYLDLGLTDEDHADLVQTLRESRPKLPPIPGPLGLLPGVSVFTGEPFLTATIHGKHSGQMSPAEARGHGMQVVEAAAAAELDANYRQFLLTAVGVDEAVAETVVGALDKYRWTG